MKDVLLASLVRSINQLLYFFLLGVLLFANPVGNNSNKPVLFADDTSLNEWFADNLLSLNFKEAQYMQFMTKNTSVDKTFIGYKYMCISNTKFLGLVITHSLYCVKHVMCLDVLNRLSQDMLKSVYYSYFHSLISYGIIWGNSSVFMSFNFNRGQLESLLGQDQGIPVEDCLRN